MKPYYLPLWHRLLQVILIGCGTLLTIGSLSSASPSERAWPIITFTCDKENQQVKIRNEVKWGDAGKHFAFNAAEGTYNPWALVAMQDRGQRKLVSESERLKLSCKLKNTEYKIVVRPKIFNPNFYASCGDRLSVIVSIYANDAILIEDKPMEKFCHGNSRVIRGIKVLAANNKVKIYEVPRSRFF